MQQTSPKAIQEHAWLGGKGDSLEIMQKKRNFPPQINGI